MGARTGSRLSVLRCLGEFEELRGMLLGGISQNSGFVVDDVTRILLGG